MNDVFVHYQSLRNNLENKEICCMFSSARCIEIISHEIARLKRIERRICYTAIIFVQYLKHITQT